jgi:hypothetical protein
VCRNTTCTDFHFFIFYCLKVFIQIIIIKIVILLLKHKTFLNIKNKMDLFFFVKCFLNARQKILNEKAIKKDDTQKK